MLSFVLIALSVRQSELGVDTTGCSHGRMPWTVRNRSVVDSLLVGMQSTQGGGVRAWSGDRHRR